MDEVLTDKIDSSSSTLKIVTEGRAVFEFDESKKVFYNPVQEFNRDLSVLAIETFLESGDHERKSRKNKLDDSVSILEAMAASGIRSVRYAKEIEGVDTVIANDISQEAYDSIQSHALKNQVSHKILPSLGDACAVMYKEMNKPVVVDIDPYGTPMPFLDAAIRCVKNGGILLITATDVAILAGNAAETCYAKYGSMSLKSDSCHEMALRILLHAVQSIANRYGRYVEPLFSLKIDFYIRIVVRVRKGAHICKDSVSQTSMVYQCTGCHSFILQPLGIKKPDGKYGFASLEGISTNCEHCDSKQHIGGPIWSGELHNKEFVRNMLNKLENKFDYLGTYARIEGTLSLVLEEISSPLFYNLNTLCSVMKTTAISQSKFRSALITLGFQVSLSHTNPNTLKTNAPNSVLWAIMREWHKSCGAKEPPPHSPSYKILHKISLKSESGVQNEKKIEISFEEKEGVTPESKQWKKLRFQMNPTKNWGPAAKSTSNGTEKKISNQNRKRGKKRKNDEGNIEVETLST